MARMSAQERAQSLARLADGHGPRTQEGEMIRRLIADVERLERELRQWEDMFVTYFGQGDKYRDELRLIEIADKALQDHFASDRMAFADLEQERDALREALNEALPYIEHQCEGDLHNKCRRCDVAYAARAADRTVSNMDTPTARGGTRAMRGDKLRALLAAGSPWPWGTRHRPYRDVLDKDGHLIMRGQTDQGREEIDAAIDLAALSPTFVQLVLEAVDACEAWRNASRAGLKPGELSTGKRNRFLAAIDALEAELP